MIVARASLRSSSQNYPMKLMSTWMTMYTVSSATSIYLEVGIVLYDNSPTSLVLLTMHASAQAAFVPCHSEDPKS